jgi:hypothetical protein
MVILSGRIWTLIAHPPEEKPARRPSGRANDAQTMPDRWEGESGLATCPEGSGKDGRSCGDLGLVILVHPLRLAPEEASEGGDAVIPRLLAAAPTRDLPLAHAQGRRDLCDCLPRPLHFGDQVCCDGGGKVP